MPSKRSTKLFPAHFPGLVKSESSIEDIEERQGFLPNTYSDTRPRHWSSLSCNTIAFLLLVIIVQSYFLLQNRSAKPLRTPNGLSRERLVDRTTYLPSLYTSKNETEADMAWDFISAGFGVVAVDPEYAEEQGLPQSLIWREDTTKRVYVIEAYHAMHCVRVIRSHYLALLRGKKWKWPLEHDMHCFDGLRQYIMCNFDDTLLWTTGHRDSGHGQKKKCQDWDALRDWAAERTISYFDYERGFRNETIFGFHSGDGLPLGSFYNP